METGFSALRTRSKIQDSQHSAKIQRCKIFTTSICSEIHQSQYVASFHRSVQNSKYTGFSALSISSEIRDPERAQVQSYQIVSTEHQLKDTGFLALSNSAEIKNSQHSWPCLRYRIICT
jgi:hypothetical protein